MSERSPEIRAVYQAQQVHKSTRKAAYECAKRLFFIAFIFLVALASSSPRLSAQSWTSVNQQAPFGAGTALLLTDGTVMVHASQTPHWFRLTPDASGSYINGTWSQLADLPPGYGPLYFASAVLPDGRVVIEGGEYNLSNTPSWTTLGAIYNPKTNSWTSITPPAGWFTIGDAQSVVLPNGTFMLANCCTQEQALLDASTLTWTPTGTGKADINDEEGWTLLPNGKVLAVDANNLANLTNSEIYNPATGSWSSAGSTIVKLDDTNSDGSGTREIGPAILRPDGTVFAAGGTFNNAIYNSLTGIWSPGPSFPSGFDMADAPAALLPNGNVLLDASPGIFLSPSHFFEFDGTSLIVAPDPANASFHSSFEGRMLVLPTGQVLFTDGSSTVQIYTPAGTFQSVWRPTIASVDTTLQPGSSNHVISGTQFNGLSQGAMYGDDAQSATNYPLVRITNNTSGHVAYCITHNHSTMALATGAASVSTQFDVPANIETGPSTLEVVANGIPSLAANVSVAVPTPDFLLQVVPNSVTMAQGTNQTVTVVVSSINGFSSPTNLSISGLPAGVTASFSPSVVTPPAGSSAQSTLTISASTTATSGIFTLQILGASGSLGHNADLTLSITGPPDFAVSASPGSISLAQGQSGSSTVTVSSINGFSNATALSVSGLPSGVTASFAPTSVTPPSGGSASSTLTLTASTSATVGTFTLTIAGTSGSLTRTTTLSLTITGPPPDFSLSVSPTSLNVSTAKGSSSTATVTVGSLNGFHSATSLSVSGLPAGVTASFAPATVTPPAGGTASSTLTLTASSSATTGTFVLKITGSSGSISHLVNLTITVGSVPQPDFSVSVAPASLSVTRGTSGTATVTVGSINGFSSATSLSISGLPGGVTASFSPATVTPPSGGSVTSTLTLTASSTATTGPFTLTISGTSGSTTHSTSLALTVVAQASADFSIGVSPSSLAVTAGGSSASSTVTISSLNGFNSATGLSIAGVPSGVSATFSPTTVTPLSGGSASSTLTIAASSAASPGTFTLTVTGTSGSLQHNATLTLQVTGSNNPVPSIANVSPSVVLSGGAGLTLTINGSGFIPSSMVNVQVGNTLDTRTPTFVSSTQLTVLITSTDIANSGQVFITVTNPAPGGGTSNTGTLNVF